MNCGSENEDIIDVETKSIDNTTAENNVKENSTLKTIIKPLLFKPRKIRVKEYWTFVSLVAPRADAGKAWKSSDAVSAYCSKCETKIPWSLKNPKHVQRHMEKFHHKFLADSKKRKDRTVDAVESKSLGLFFATKKKKDLQPALRSDQIKGEALLVNWIATSLRPFSIVEDSRFRDFVDFLSNLNKQFSIPGRLKVREQLESYGELVRMKFHSHQLSHAL